MSRRVPKGPPRNPRFRVLAELDGHRRFQEATVTIRRGALVLEVRPLRRRRVYALPLSEVAVYVYRRVGLAVAAEKKRAAKAKRSGGLVGMVGGRG